MFEHQIIEEINRYLKDNSYQYAVLIDGEWGCGKTYFVKHTLLAKIQEFEQNCSKRTPKYISLYGCKTIQDVQEAMVWIFADEAKKYIVQKTARHMSPRIQNIPAYLKQKTPKNMEPALGSILSTSKKILQKVGEKFFPNVNFFEFSSDWFLMKDFIFIFDDLERCDCPINELFGFINGLVEHEGTKVILIANEKEICMQEIHLQKELQYLLALNDKIECPEKENQHNYTHNTSQKISISELEQRRHSIFADGIYNTQYKKIREKLIGISLYYQPNIKEICRELIANITLEDTLARELEAHIDLFYQYMNIYSHHNLRTFQFFISKISYLCLKLSDLEIETDDYDAVRSFLIQDCFIWSIDFKSEYKPPAGTWEKFRYEEKTKSLAVKKYVETGEFIPENFRSDIFKYINEQLHQRISDNDPLSLLTNGFYFHSQKWCEEQLQLIKDRLLDDKYPFFAYQKIIILLQRLIDIGFQAGYMNEFMLIMLNNVEKSENPVMIDSDLFFLENVKFREKILLQLSKLNNAIAEKNDLSKEKGINDILNGSNWADELEKFITVHQMSRNPDSILFSKAPSDIWIKNISESTAADINTFRHSLSTLYPTDSIRNSTCFDDLAVLKNISNAIHPENSDDLIVRANLKILKKQLESIIELYQKN